MKGGQFLDQPPHFHHPLHIPTAFRARPEQQQVACLDSGGEVGDGDRVAALVLGHTVISVENDKR